MTIIQRTFIQSTLEPRAYIPTLTRKTNIVLHNSFSRTKYTFTSTENSEASLIKKWNILGDKYAGHYVVGRSGDIYECLSEDFWTNHTALPKKFNDYNKSTIAVFLSNEAYLVKENSKYYAFGINRQHNIYTGPVFKKVFRGYQYWADYEVVQIKRMLCLLRDICERNGLPLTLYKNLETHDLASADKATVVSCANLNNTSFSLAFPDWVFNEAENHGFKIVD